MTFSVRVQHFKSFQDTGELTFEPGLNVLVGKNSVGKSALLKMLNFALNWFRTPEGINPSYYRRGQLTMCEIVVPLPESWEQRFKTTDSGIELEYIRANFNGHGQCEYIKTKVVTSDEWVNCIYVAPQNVSNQYKLSQILYDRSGQKTLPISNHTSFPNYSPLTGDILRSIPYWGELVQTIPEVIFIPPFREIKLSNGLQTEEILQPNGGNIHNVLLKIASEHDGRLAPVQRFICEIFPQYTEIVPRMIKNNQGSFAEIHLKDKQTGSLIPISECGAGVGQLLLLASLVVLRKEPTVFLMDEPHAFLHPEAERKLVQFLKSYGHHTYVIATHSITTINNTEPSRLFLLRSTNETTAVTRFIENEANLDIVLEALGLHNSDLAMFNKLLLVEGDTEEKILKQLLSVCGYDLNALGIGVINIIGSSSKDYVRKMHRNYRASLRVTVPHRFILDRDEGDGFGKEDEIYLDVREIENYFLQNPRAVLYGIQQDPYYLKFAHESPDDSFVMEIANLNEDNVRKMIEERLQNPDFFKRDVDDDELPWKVIKGSEVLADIFTGLKLQYSKVDHGQLIAPRLTKSDLFGLSSVVEDFLIDPVIEDPRVKLLRVLYENGFSEGDTRVLLS